MKRMIYRTAVILAAASAFLCGCGSPKENGSAQGADMVAEAGTDKNAADGLSEGGPAQGADMAAEAGTDKNAADGLSEGGPAQGADMAAGTGQTLLAGTTLSVYGDSISTYQGYNPVGYSAFFPEYGEIADVEDTWWQEVADSLELTLYVNGSSSGATVAGDSTGTQSPQCACNELRTNDLAGPGGACPDRIIVYLGTNDMLKAVPLGDNDGTRIVEEGEVDTFSDAYTLMLDKLQANYPLSEIYCCTLLPVGDYGSETPYVEFVNAGKLTSADYGEVIARIAENRGLAVIDLYDCGVAIENLQEMTSDGVHPTARGMECIAGAVMRAFTG